MADNLYQVLEGIQVSREEIVEAETFTKQYLRANFPSLDLREGVALYDLLIRPASTLVALLNKGIVFYFSNNTISGTTDSTPEDMVDKILSNLFLSRLQGNSSIVKARLYFIAKNRDVFLPTSSSFSLDNVTFFKPIVDTLINNGESTDPIPGDFIYDPSREEYYYDIDLISSAQDDSANVESGEFIYYSNIDPYFVGGEILYLSQKAIAKETNSEFISRASTAISTRNLINNPSIDSIIKATFNYVKNVVPVGYGDEEMTRDLVEVQKFGEAPGVLEQIHIGGKVDIYVDAPVASQAVAEVKQYTADASGYIYIPAVDGGFSYVIFDLRKAVTTDSDEAALLIPTDTLPTVDPIIVTYGEIVDSNFFVIDDVHDVGFSARQVARVYLGPSGAGKSVTLRYWRFTGVVGIQEFLDDRANKVVSADYLARSLDNYAIDINIKRIGNGGFLTEAQLITAQEKLSDYFYTLKAGQTLIVSELIEVLRTQAGITDLDAQLEVSFTLFDRKFQLLAGNPLATGTIVSSKTCERTQRFILRNVTSA